MRIRGSFIFGEITMFRRVILGLAAMSLISTASLSQTAQQTQEDPYLWLEDVMGEKAIAWVKEQNAKTQKLLEAEPQFGPIRDQVLEVVNSRERIPAATKRGEFLYNFWQDQTHIRGVWRRTTMAEYKKPQPNWETVLDLDQLAKDEKENWVWKGSTCLYPRYELCMLNLPFGKKDSVKMNIKKGYPPITGGYSQELKNLVAKNGIKLIFTDYALTYLAENGYDPQFGARPLKRLIQKQICI